MKRLTGEALLEAMLELPTPTQKTYEPKPAGMTRSIEASETTAVVELKLPVPASEAELGSEASRVLTEHGLNPDDWAVTRFRSSEWTMANGSLGTSARFSFEKRAAAVDAVEPVNIDELIAVTKAAPRSEHPVFAGGSPWGFIVQAGDMQWGKMDGDGPEGTVSRAIASLENAARLFDLVSMLLPIGSVEMAWMGDHGEGFVSQGGMNAWRTRLPQMEQDRLSRRTMLHGVQLFAGRARQVQVVAVPGNHGEAVRFGKGGVTRYDDSHDTEALVAVAEACALNPDAFGHVSFHVPDNDELLVTTELAGTVISHHHGHKFGRRGPFGWWEGQTFGGFIPQQASLLLAGHGHSYQVLTQGERMFIQSPALESESTYFRHMTGIAGGPGMSVALTRDGVTIPLGIV